MVVALVVGDDARDGVRVIVPHAAGGDAAEHVAFSVRACCQCGRSLLASIVRERVRMARAQAWLAECVRVRVDGSSFSGSAGVHCVRHDTDGYYSSFGRGLKGGI